MDQLKFLIQGSSPEPYEVTFSLEGINLTAHCTCPAGQFGQYCKHRINLLAGDPKNVVSDNADQVPLVGQMAKGTDVHSVLEELLETDAVFQKAKADVSRLKKELAKAMND